MQIPISARPFSLVNPIPDSWLVYSMDSVSWRSRVSFLPIITGTWHLTRETKGGSLQANFTFQLSLTNKRKRDVIRSLIDAESEKSHDQRSNRVFAWRWRFCQNNFSRAKIGALHLPRDFYLLGVIGRRWDGECAIFADRWPVSHHREGHDVVRNHDVTRGGNVRHPLAPQNTGCLTR